MRLTLVLFLLLAARALLFADQTLLFVEDDLSTVAITVPDPATPCDPSAACLADRDFLQFQSLSDDDPLPKPLDYLARGAWSRYAILGYGFPGRWTARDVREVFLSCDDLRSFMVAHYSPAPGKAGSAANRGG